MMKKQTVTWGELGERFNSLNTGDSFKCECGCYTFTPSLMLTKWWNGRLIPSAIFKCEKCGRGYDEYENEVNAGKESVNGN